MVTEHDTHERVAGHTDLHAALALLALALGIIKLVRPLRQVGSGPSPTGRRAATASRSSS